MGFIVKKPIPDAFIGRTILNTYPETNESIEQGYLTGKRHILSLKEYSANIFGANFAINSLVFQEQDSIISDCATTALWTVLQKAGSKFGYYSPSPYEIKISASEHYGRIRPLPASGLNLLQIIEAIKSFNMEYQVKDYTEEGIEADRLTFLNFCYSYLRGGLPIFLGVNIEDDYHALAILGYHLSSEKNITESLPFLGCKIDKLYLHDDNIGPFVRAKVNNDSEENLVLNYEGKEMIPQSVIIPIYHKIRYPTTEIYEYINEFHNLLIQILQEKVGLEWDCYITTVNQYKNEILKNSNYEVYPQEKKKKILSEFMPKYLWRCILRIDDIILLDLLADATEARINNPFFFITCNSETLTEELRERLGDWVKKSYFSKSGFAEFLYERFSL
ncbi:MAG: hypothetical protein ACOCT9_01880 [archaeon]